MRRQLELAVVIAAVLLTPLSLEGQPARPAADSTGLRPLPRPAVVRGLYVNRWAVLGKRIWELVGVARRTEVNALVIDVKDDRGYVLYRSGVPLARQIGADTTSPVSGSRMRAILDSMRASGIHAIARIVVAKDPLLARAKSEWAVRRRSDGAPWLDAAGNPWLDPHHQAIWSYASDLAAESVRLGFSEVQFDYVRFPDAPRLIREATFPLAKGRVRAQVIREQLGFMRERLRPLAVPMAIDVFGLTTTDSTDMGIGQRWEQFADQADIVLPMTVSVALCARNVRHHSAKRASLRDHRACSAGCAGAKPQCRQSAGDCPVVSGLHVGGAALRRETAPRADAGGLRQRHQELDAVESRKQVHGRSVRAGKTLGALPASAGTRSTRGVYSERSRRARSG